MRYTVLVYSFITHSMRSDILYCSFIFIHFISQTQLCPIFLEIEKKKQKKKTS